MDPQLPVAPAAASSAVILIQTQPFPKRDSPAAGRILPDLHLVAYPFPPLTHRHS